MIKLSNKYKKVLVTGGAGFIGGTFIRKLLNDKNIKIFNLDKLTYASDLTSIDNLIKKLNLKKDNNYKLLNIDLADKQKVENAILEIKPDLIVHMAAESHVDRSIQSPEIFVRSNILGTFNLLETSRIFWNSLPIKRKELFKFIHISTDEVFGSIDGNESFTESSKYDPRSPYSATKASSDHLVSAYKHTYDFPAITTNCSNNFGPWQFPEKFIPLVISKALNGEEIPIYGDGLNVRDWLFVEDHVDALITIINTGKIGEKYCIGGQGEKTNLEVVQAICTKMNDLINLEKNFIEQISFVRDRPGHDRRYSINPSKIINELNWSPKFNFDKALDHTIKWYLRNQEWCNVVKYKANYNGNRIG